MRLINYKIDEVAHGAKTLMNACNYIPALEKEHGYVFSKYESEQYYDMCGSGIQTRIIQTVGRFCERYASDCLYELMKLDPFLTEYREGENRWVICLGIRECGVDDSAAIMQRLKEQAENSEYLHAGDIYRKILAIDIQDFEGEYGQERTIELKDITHKICRIADEDKEN